MNAYDIGVKSRQLLVCKSGLDGEMRGLPSKLRNLLTAVRAHVSSKHGAYPNTVAALDNLQAALEAEFPHRVDTGSRARRVAKRDGDHRKRAVR